MPSEPDESAPAISTTLPPATVTLPPIELNAFTDLGLLPVEYYATSPCQSVSQLPGSAGEVDYDVGGYHFDGPDEVRESAESVVVATVTEVGTPLTVTPVGLPDDFVQASGATTVRQLEWAMTPVSVAVDQVVAGDVDASTLVVLELGCLAPGANAVTTVGSELLLLVDSVEPGVGAPALFGGTSSVVDWLAVGADGTLVDRVGVQGLPSRAGFLVGQTMHEATRLLGAPEAG